MGSLMGHSSSAKITCVRPLPGSNPGAVVWNTFAPSLNSSFLRILISTESGKRSLPCAGTAQRFSRNAQSSPRGADEIGGDNRVSPSKKSTWERYKEKALRHGACYLQEGRSTRVKRQRGAGHAKRNRSRRVHAGNSPGGLSLLC